MNRIVIIVLRVTGIVFMLACLAAAAVWGYIMRPKEEVCPSITYRFLDGRERMYIEVDELNSLLRNQDIYPVGRRLSRLAVYRIENAVGQHPMVEQAECYLTPQGDVKVEITQRQPLLLVRTESDTYYIDTRHRPMPVRPQIKDPVLLVTGTVGPQMAATQLAEFAEWLQANRYWRERIHRVQVRSPRMVVVYVEGAQVPRVLLGELTDYERKLAKLRTFMENSAEVMQDKHYAELDIRFRGQVIGRN